MTANRVVVAVIIQVIVIAVVVKENYKMKKTKNNLFRT